MTRSTHNWDLRTWDLRPIWIGITVMLLIAFAFEVAFLYRVIDDQTAVGVDHRFYVDVARRWLDTGVFYTDRQLSGPYQTQTLVDNLYPPHALYLFIPFTVLPWFLWWVLPLGLMAYVVWWCRPQPWGLAVIAMLLLYPKSPNLIIYGNTDMWVGAAVAAGVRWGWPATLASFKPSLIFFGILGIATRAWWIAAALIVAVSLPFASVWQLYPTIMGNSSSKPWYSFADIPFLLIPIAAWLFSSYRGDVSLTRWAAALLRDTRAMVRNRAAVR
jgi:hypothetical protein